MKSIKNFLTEDTASNGTLSNYESNYDVDKLSEKINNDLYHNTNHDGTPEETDEIIINLNGYKFIYRLEE